MWLVEFLGFLGAILLRPRDHLCPQCGDIMLDDVCENRTRGSH